MRSRNRRRSASLAVLALVALHLSGCAAPEQPRVAQLTSPAARGTSYVVFLGDSIVAGIPGAMPAWPTVVSDRMGWSFRNLAMGGTGYVTTVAGGGHGACGLATCPTIPEMARRAVDLAPDVVFVAGGRNDGSKNVLPAAQDLFHSLRAALPRAKIVCMSPYWTTVLSDSLTAQYEKGMREVAAREAVTFLEVGYPLVGRPDLMTPDNVHPNVAGQQAIAQAVLAALPSDLREE